MKGRIIDMNSTDAFVSFDDGTTMDIGVARLPHHAVVGDIVNIDFDTYKNSNDKLEDFF